MMSFEVRNFLSDKHQITYNSLQPPLRRMMEDRLFNGEKHRIQLVRTVLDILYTVQEKSSAINANRYFTLLLGSNQESDLDVIAKIVQIAKKGKIDQLFTLDWSDHRSPSKTSLEEHVKNFFKKSNINSLPLPSIPVFNERSFDQFFIELKNWLSIQGPNGLPLDKIKNEEIVESLKIPLVKVVLASSGIQNSDLEKILKMSVRLTEKYGSEMVLRLIEGMLPGPIKGCDLMAIFNHLNSIDNEDLFDVVDRFARRLISLNQFKEILNGKNAIPSFTTIQDKGIDDLLSRLYTDPSVKMRLSDPLLQKIKQQYLAIEKYFLEWKHFSNEILIDMAKKIEKDADPEALEKFIVIAKLTLFYFQNEFLTNTQIFTLLGLLAGNQSTIAQVKTGEGKSLITAAFAFALAMQKRAVDVISSSSSLSKRDADKFKPFFAQFDLIVNHICHKDLKAELFKAHILFGTPSDFEFALMREQLYSAEFFKHRPILSFDAVIVDEADNLTIDTQLNAARLGIPAPFSFEWVYAPLYKALADNPHLTVVDLRNLLLEIEGGKYANEVADLEDGQILLWKNSALTAKNSEERKDYVVRILENEPVVVIVDKDNTGQLNLGSRWQKGIHEFLEVKHRIPVQKESLNPLSMSHVVFYRKYKSLYGLTGTLGSDQERNQIAKTYNVLLFDVPPFKPSIRQDLKALIMIDVIAYYEAIYLSVKGMIAKGRPVLIISESIEDSIILSEKFTEKQIPHQLYNELQSEKEEAIIEKAGDPGRVTIATNNAARGCNIRLLAQSKLNGGLHSLITFYPKTLRVEEQARGRAGRQGDPGSSQMIILKSHLHPMDRIELGLSRKLYEEKMSAYCNERAEIEIHTQSKIESFYSKLALFRNKILSPMFIKTYAEEIANYSIYSPANLQVPRNQEDRFIKDEINNLLRKRKACADEMRINRATRWEELLRRIGKRIIEISILEWTLSFFQKMESINIKDSSLAEKKQDIDDLFKNVRSNWEKYLNNPPAGLVKYAKEITGVNLENLILK